MLHVSEVVPIHARLDAEAIPGRLLPPMRICRRGRTDALADTLPVATRLYEVGTRSRALVLLEQASSAVAGSQIPCCVRELITLGGFWLGRLNLHEDVTGTASRLRRSGS